MPNNSAPWKACLKLLEPRPESPMHIPLLTFPSKRILRMQQDSFLIYCSEFNFVLLSASLVLFGGDKEYYININIYYILIY